MARRIKRVYKTLNFVHEKLFMATNGRLGGTAAGMTVVRLTTVGRKSGEERVAMLTSPLVEGDTVVLVASFRGGPNHPAWYYNLKERPQVRAMRRGRDLQMTAEILSGERRAQLWNRIVTLEPRYSEYQRRTPREIPLIVLTPS